MRCILLLIVLSPLAACGGLTDPAQYEVVTYVSAVYAINGSPLGAPTAINTATALTVRADLSYDFDIAFDLDDMGRPVVFTQRVVGLPEDVSGHAVSLQAIEQTFDSIIEAPGDGWVTDSLLTVPIGQAFVVRAQPAVCASYDSPYVYSKAVIDSVKQSTRQLWLTVVTDPNCGYRSLELGYPTR